MGYTIETTDWLGQTKEEHFDDDGNRIAETRNVEDWLGNRIQEHYDSSGDKVGETRPDWLGGPAQIHYDSVGNEVGQTHPSWFGNSIQEHYDSSGSKVGETCREDFPFGTPNTLRHFGRNFKAGPERVEERLTDHTSRLASGTETLYGQREELDQVSATVPSSRLAAGDGAGERRRLAAGPTPGSRSVIHTVLRIVAQVLETAATTAWTAIIAIAGFLAGYAVGGLVGIGVWIVWFVINHSRMSDSEIAAVRDATPWYGSEFAEGGALVIGVIVALLSLGWAWRNLKRIWGIEQAG